MTDTAPADWSDQELLQYLLKHQPEPASTAADQAAGVAKQSGVGLAKGLTYLAGAPGDLGELGAQGIDWATKRVGNAMGLDLRRPGTQQSLSNQVTGEPPKRETLTGFTLPGAADIQHKVEGVTGEWRKPQSMAEEYADTISSFVPGMLTGPVGAAANTSRVANLLANVGKRFVTNVAVPGALSETAGQVTKGTSAEPYARFAGALASPVLTSAYQFARRPPYAPNIPPERQAAWDRMAQEGAGENLSVGQITGNVKRRYNETTAGDRAQVMEQASLEDLTKAATRRFGEENTNFHDALSAGHARIGSAIEESAGRMKVRMDPALGDALVGLDRATFNEGLNPDQVNRLRAVRDHVVNTFETVARPSGKGADFTEMSGKSFQNLIAKNSVLQRAIDEGGNIGYYAKKMRDALFDAADRTATRQGTREGVGNRQALEDFRKARREYANMKAMEEGAPAAGEKVAQGLLTPAALRQIATNRDKADYFLGRGDYAQLARDANMLMTPLPNSGTAQRLKAQWPTQIVGGLVGAGLGGPIPAVGPAVGAAVGTAVAPAVRGKMVRLTPWWLDQDIARRRHVANLLASGTATERLAHDQGPSQ